MVELTLVSYVDPVVLDLPTMAWEECSRQDKYNAIQASAHPDRGINVLFPVGTTI